MGRGELVARALVLALAVALLAVSGARGSDVQTPKRGGTLVTPRPEPACLNPFACNVLPVDPSLTQVLEGAFEVGPDLVYRPSLVRNVTIDRNPFTLTYHLRRDARWSDGTRVTAADFQFTHSKLATLPMPAFDQREQYGRVRRAQVLDARTFRIEFREPSADWRELYPIVLPRHALVGQDLTKVWIDRIDNPKTGRPIGSGPFVVERLERGKSLTLVRNPRYWGPHTAYLDRYVLRFLDPQDPIGPLQRNEIDMTLGIGTFLTAERAKEVRKLPGWRVAAWPAPVLEHLAFRVGPGGHPALRSKLVRRALAFGIDRVAIARAILSEAESPARRPLDSTVFLPGQTFYRPHWSRYRYDPPRARRLLEEAGCRRSEGIYSCGGERLSLRFVTTAGSPERLLIMQLVQDQLARVGVEVEPTFATFAALFGQILPNGSYDAVLFAWINNGGGVAWPEARCGDAQNWTGFCSRLIMRDLQQTDLIVDPKQRARVLNAGDAKLARAVPVLPLTQAVLRAAIRSRVRGVVPGGSQINLFQNTEDWWLAAPR
jgi:peptide/nickel transport system substrate-binding protein